MKKNKSEKARTPFDWTNVEGKREIVFAIVQWLRDDPDPPKRIDAYRKCADTRKITEDEIIYPVKLPKNAEIYCLRQGDEALGPIRKAYASLVVEIPPDQITDPKEVLRYACTYNLWVGLRPKGKRKKRAKTSSKRSK